MKLLVYQLDGSPIEIEAHHVRVMCGQDHFEMRTQVEHGGAQSLLIQLEEHDGGLAMDLAVFPTSANGVRLKGGLR